MPRHIDNLGASFRGGSVMGDVEAAGDHVEQEAEPGSNAVEIPPLGDPRDVTEPTLEDRVAILEAAANHNTEIFTRLLLHLFEHLKLPLPEKPNDA